MLVSSILSITDFLGVKSPLEIIVKQRLHTINSIATNAVDLVKIGSSQFGGKGGGGRPMMAQSGGNDINASNATIDALIKYIKEIN